MANGIAQSVDVLPFDLGYGGSISTRCMYVDITVGISWVLLASATSRFSGYIKLAYCSSAKGAPVAQLVRASD